MGLFCCPSLAANSNVSNREWLAIILFDSAVPQLEVNCTKHNICNCDTYFQFLSRLRQQKSLASVGPSHQFTGTFSEPCIEFSLSVLACVMTAFMERRSYSGCQCSAVNRTTSSADD